MSPLVRLAAVLVAASTLRTVLPTAPRSQQPGEVVVRKEERAPHGRPPASPAAERVDSTRLLADLSALAHDSMQGRGTGTPGAARARRYLSAAVRESGAQPVGASFEHPFEWAGGTGVNVVAVIPGRERPQARLLVTAHYDHEGVKDGVVFNGADDNASGVAVLLAIARSVAADPLGPSVVFAALDAEEAGLQGARAFASAPPLPLESFELVVNLDMVARTGGVLWAAGAHHTPALRPVLERVAAGAPHELRLGHDRPGAPEGADWTRSSDHAPFHAAGLPFVYFGVEDHADYHRPTDDVERIDPADFVAAARTILAAVRGLAAALPLDPGP